MAITNAQQFKQLVNPPMKGNKRPGYRGDDAARSSEGTSGGRASPGAGAGFGDGPSRGRSKGNTAREQGIMNQYQGPRGTTLGFNRGPTEIIGGKEFAINPTTPFEQEQKNFAISIANDRRRTEARKRALKERTFLEKLNKLGYTDRTLDSNLEDFGAIDSQGFTIGGVKVPSSINALSEFTVDPATKSFDIDSIRELASTKTTTGGSMSAKDAETLGDIREDIQMRSRIQDPNDNVTQSEFEEYMNRNKIEETGGDGPQDPCKGPNPPAYCFVGIRSAEAATPVEEESEESKGLRLAFRADGGPIGGEYDFESARQMYGLGKLVKKVTRTVKKIAKSPIGKAAIAGSLTFGIPGVSSGFFSKGLMGTKTGLGVKNFLANKILGNPIAGDVTGTRTGGLLDMIGGKVGASIIGASVVGGLLTPEEEEQAEELSRGEGIDIEQARNSILAARRDDYKMDFRARGFKAEGGPAEGKEPVAKKTMPLLDMDGKEMDLRAEGGFVPIGRMEKADDVPARLSKNEFVFTADAVRNAGEGNVDKGAEVMYNMMKNLESGGEVSEESQGLEGARKMFQTSQRLEEVL